MSNKLFLKTLLFPISDLCHFCLTCLWVLIFIFCLFCRFWYIVSGRGGGEWKTRMTILCFGHKSTDLWNRIAFWIRKLFGKPQDGVYKMPICITHQALPPNHTCQCIFSRETIFEIQFMPIDKATIVSKLYCVSWYLIDSIRMIYCIWCSTVKKVIEQIV